MMVFPEIWPEHSLIDKKQNGVGEFLVAAFNATHYANFSTVELDRSKKRLPIEIEENADTLLEIEAL